MSLWIRPFAAALLITTGLTACSSEEQATSPSPGVASSPSAGSPSEPVDTATSSPSNTLRDPMLDLTKGERMDEIGENLPTVTKRGNQHGEFVLPESVLAGDVVVAVTCGGTGRFTVESDKKLVLSSACSDRANATIRLAGDRFAKTVSVTAPGDFWFVIVPTVNVNAAPSNLK